MPAPNDTLVINGRRLRRPQGCSEKSWKELLKEVIANSGGKEYIPCDIYGRSEDDRQQDKVQEEGFRTGATDVDELEFKQMYDTERRLYLEGKAEVVQLLLAKTETSEQIKKFKADGSGAVNIPKLKADLQKIVETTLFAKEEKTVSMSFNVSVLTSDERINVGQYIIGTEKQNQKLTATRELESTLKAQVEQIAAKEIVLIEIENEIRVNIVAAHKTFMDQVLAGKGGKERTTYAGRRCVAGAILKEEEQVKRPLEAAEVSDNNKRAALARSDTLNPNDFIVANDPVSRLHLAVNEIKKAESLTKKACFIYYGRKLEEGSQKLLLLDGHLINEDAFTNVVMRKWIGNMSEADAEVLKQKCVSGLGKGEKFDRVSVARILNGEEYVAAAEPNTQPF